eukprot:843816-Rhodomonas_salina.1
MGVSGRGTNGRKAGCIIAEDKNLPPAQHVSESEQMEFQKTRPDQNCRSRIERVDGPHNARVAGSRSSMLHASTAASRGRDRLLLLLFPHHAVSRRHHRASIRSDFCD